MDHIQGFLPEKYNHHHISLLRVELFNVPFIITVICSRYKSEISFHFDYEFHYNITSRCHSTRTYYYKHFNIYVNPYRINEISLGGQGTILSVSVLGVNYLMRLVNTRMSMELYHFQCIVYICNIFNIYIYRYTRIRVNLSNASDILYSWQSARLHDWDRSQRHICVEKNSNLPFGSKWVAILLF